MIVLFVWIHKAYHFCDKESGFLNKLFFILFKTKTVLNLKIKIKINYDCGPLIYIRMLYHFICNQGMLHAM